MLVSIDITTQFILLSIRYDTIRSTLSLCTTRVIHNLYMYKYIHMIWCPPSNLCSYGVNPNVDSLKCGIEKIDIACTYHKYTYTYYINKHNNQTENQKHHRTPYTHTRSQFFFIQTHTHQKCEPNAKINRQQFSVLGLIC